MSSPKHRPHLYKFLAAATGIALIASSGCTQDSETTGSVNPAATNAAIATGSQSALAKATQDWQRKFERDPQNSGYAINYSRHLRAMGRSGEAIGVMRQSVAHHPNDGQVLGELGKVLAANGSFDDALRTLERATSGNNPDWRLISAKGAVLDQMGRNEQAQAAYQQALAISPDEPSIQSNLGLSYALSGDLVRAEHTLRQAMTHPRATQKVRENLVLVLGLQGRFEEAEKVAIEGGLSRAEVASNTAYLRSMLSQPDRWAELKEE